MTSLRLRQVTQPCICSRQDLPAEGKRIRTLKIRARPIPPSTRSGPDRQRSGCRERNEICDSRYFRFPELEALSNAHSWRGRQSTGTNTQSPPVVRLNSSLLVVCKC